MYIFRKESLNLGIKNKLKTIPWLYDLNAYCKAYATKTRYNKTISYYAGKKQHWAFSYLLDKRVGDRIKRLQQVSELNIFFLGTDEKQDRSGILQALEKFGNLTCFRRTDGSYGQNYPGLPAERRATNTKILLELFNSLAKQGRVPHLLIGQTWASFIDPKAFSNVRDNYGTIVVNIAMDDRHQYWGKKIYKEWSGTYALIPHIDLSLTTAPECVDWYMKEGCPAMFFPEASDPDIFHPMPLLPKLHDVCFVGGCYGIRKKIVEAIESSGIKVTAYGDGWPNGRIRTEDVPALFAQSRIILGIGTIGHCTDFYSLKMRDFDGPMSGSLYLTHHNPDLEDLYVIGKEIETYKTPEECVEKVRYYLNHPDEAEAVGHAGRIRAEKEHTWEKRFEKVFRTVGVLER